VKSGQRTEKDEAITHHKAICVNLSIGSLKTLTSENNFASFGRGKFTTEEGRISTVGKVIGINKLPGMLQVIKIGK